MSLENVIQEIKEQSEKEKQAILKEAKQEAEKILSEARAKAHALEQKGMEEAQVFAQETKNKELSQFRLEQNKKIMQTKSQAIQEIFRTALGKTEKMNETQRKQVLKKLLEKAMTELPKAKYYYSNKRDSKLIQELHKDLKCAGEINCISGLVLENEDQTIKVNYTFEVLFEKTKEEALHEISSNAF